MNGPDRAMRRCRSQRPQQAAISFLCVEDAAVYAVDEPEQVPAGLTRDTGAVDHVTDRADVPGCEVTPSEGSKRGQRFLATSCK